MNDKLLVKLIDKLDEGKAKIELCSSYATTGHPTFKPSCKLGYKAGLWCHKYDLPHYCNEYNGGKVNE